jgi:hypothetical protein
MRPGLCSVSEKAQKRQLVDSPGPSRTVLAQDWGNWVSENPVHWKFIRAFVHSPPSPLRLELPLHIGFLRMSSGTSWVSENSVHRKPKFPRTLLLGSSVNRGSGIPLLGDEATEASRYGLKYNQPATDHSA